MKQFSYGDIHILVRRATVRDGHHATAISNKAQSGAPDGEWGTWDLFGELCASVQKCKGLSFDPKTLADAKDTDVQAAYKTYEGFDKEFKLLWVAAYKEANAPSGKASEIVTVEDEANLNW